MTNTSFSTGWRHPMAALVLAWVGLGGCGDDNPGAAASGTADAGRDAGVDAAAPSGPIVPAMTVGGTIPAPPPDTGPEAVVLPTPYVGPSGCCAVTLGIADPDGNETTAMLVGDLPPLSQGVPLAWKDGRWSAMVCLPVEEQFTYRFYFGKKPLDVLKDDEGSSQDAGIAGAEGIDAGASDAEPLPVGGSDQDAAAPLVDDYRFDPTAPTGTNDDGSTQNVYPAISVCGTTGM